MSGTREKKKLSLTTWIALGLVLGVIAGLAFQGAPDVATEYIKPFGTIYLNLIKMVVVPVVLLSIMHGIVSLQDVRKVGSIGVKTICFYLVTTAIAITLGLVLANVLQVGAGYTISTEGLSYEAAEAPSLMDTIVNIFPSNFFQPLADATMLQVIVIALFFGFGIILAGEKGKLAKDLVDSCAEVSFKVMFIILKLSPIGVFALICPVVASNGPDVLLPLLKVILVAYAAYIIHMIVTYSTAVKLASGMSPLKFFKGMSEPILFAFSSASSVGTLPFNMDATQQMGARKEVSSFVLPLGATINMDGTAIYQCVATVFLASCAGMNLTLGNMVLVVVTATLASIGTAGVSGAGMIMLAMVLEAIGVPVAYIGLIVAVDRLFDMGRTCLNVTGDISCSLCVTQWEAKKAARKAAKQTR